jgi:RNA polymerase sigma factor (sigma-70 family)
MASSQVDPIIRHVRRAAASPTDQLSDSHLLQCFASRGDAAAFEALVRRHGPLVLAVCRRLLGDVHAAEDAFQAVFLVLARRAGALARPESLGPWLHGVAARTALKARGRAARRRLCERRAAVTAAVAPPDELAWRDLAPLLDEAVNGLPEKYRSPFVLHHLEGKSVADVARHLGWPAGTVAARLARARERLRTVLTRRGVTPPAGALAAALGAAKAMASVPTPLVISTVGAVVGHVSEATVASAPVALVTEVSRMMCGTKGKLVGMGLVVAAVMGVAGLVVPAPPTRSGKTGEPAQRPEGGRAVVKARRYVLEPPDMLLLEVNGAFPLEVHSLAGNHLVRPDGTCGLGVYGSVPVADLTVEQAADAIAAKLREAGATGNLTAEQVRRGVSVDVTAYNSKVYYVITNTSGQGDQVSRLPLTGNETILDALSGLPALPARPRITVKRENKVLPVDWKGITGGGVSATNYQLMPGDRVYIESSQPDPDPAGYAANARVFGVEVGKFCRAVEAAQAAFWKVLSE